MCGDMYEIPGQDIGRQKSGEKKEAKKKGFEFHR
jgi:hypothetical protein